MLRRNKVLFSIIVFLATYPLFLALWIQVKTYYGTLLTEGGAQLAAHSMGVSVDDIRPSGDIVIATFVIPVLTQEGVQQLLLDVKLSVSIYSFNVPLTFSLVVCLFPLFRWRWRSILEIALILIGIHLFFVYSYCALQIYRQLVINGIREHSKILQLILECSWVFTDNLVIRFEPFLAVVYLYLRRSRPVFPLDPGQSSGNIEKVRQHIF